MKLPGPDHPITIRPHPGSVRVVAGNAVLAESEHAVSLTEASYPPVRSLPRDDVSMDRLVRTDHHTHCPYKGKASYFSVVSGDQIIENAAWSYEEPYPAMERIRGHLAFYPNKVAIEDG